MAGGDVHQVALAMLGRRALSAAEVGERLLRRGFPEPTIKLEIARLKRSGLLDDASLARAICRFELARDRGRRAIFYALRRRSIDKVIGETALAEIADDDLEHALKMALLQAVRRYPNWRSLPPARRKVIRYLLARGFGLADVQHAIGQHLGDEQNGARSFEPGNSSDFP